MALSIRDTKLKSLYSDLEKGRQTNPSVHVDDQKVVELLAAVGDSSSLSGAKVLAQLRAGNLTREQQVALVQKGLTANEKKDLAAILDRGTVPLAPSARNFLEAVLGRAPVQPGAPLKLDGTFASGITGTVGPGATIEAINISAANIAGTSFGDAKAIATADQFGRFTGQLPGIAEGDLVKLRARYADGKTGDWLTVKAAGLARADTTNATLWRGRLNLKDVGGGQVSLENLDAGKAVSEPGAKVQLRNERTGARQVVVLDADGNVPAGTQLAGKGGDTFAVAVSDGANNPDFAVEAGTVTVPGGTEDLIADPGLHADQKNADGSPKYGKTRFTGPLFNGTISSDDVAQGSLGDCYFAAALSAIAFTDPEAIRKLITDDGDGTFTATFKQRDYATGRYRDVKVKLDGDLYVKVTGTPLYGRSTGPQTAPSMELWYPLLEKAYAQWRGSYDRIGNGGWSHQVFQEVLGAQGSYQPIGGAAGADKTWAALKQAIDNEWPICASTFGETEEARYTNSGVYANHAYAVLGYEEKDGQRLVKLRNPWSYSEPNGDGKDDGVFLLPLERFTHLYQSLSIGRR